MKENKVGFTLIELLVVVLIIGILAAIALPQYQKAVERARMQEAIVNLTEYEKAQALNYLSNGSYQDSLTLNGDIKLSLPDIDTALANGEAYGYSNDTSSGKLLLVKAHRLSGKYKGAFLGVYRYEATSPSRSCYGPVEFCKMSGYGNGTSNWTWSGRW